jgi:hypothetical protein
MTPAGIRIVWKPGAAQAAEDEFEELVVGSFKGNCSVVELETPTVMPAKTNVLADTAVRRGGQVLPFFNVDCERVIRILRPTLDSLSVPLRHSVFGRALARVMAHEIYHILAHTTEHDESGAAKPSFSREDLLIDGFAFDRASLERMPRPASTATLN